jgi:hypothetical protein
VAETQIISFIIGFFTGLSIVMNIAFLFSLKSEKNKSRPYNTHYNR